MSNQRAKKMCSSTSIYPGRENDGSISDECWDVCRNNEDDRGGIMIGLFRPADKPFACDDVGVDTVERMPMIDMIAVRRKGM